MANPSKACSGCGVNKPADEFHRQASSPDGRVSKCKPCKAAYTRQWYVANADKVRAASKSRYLADPARARDLGLQREYGINLEQYDTLLRHQQGRCAACLRFPDGRNLAVDHDHATGLIRGLLCLNCNRRVIGRYRGAEGANTLDRAARYLRNPPAQDIMRGHRVSERRPNGRKWDNE